MKKYSVGMQLLGYERVEVEAENEVEAFEAAKRKSDYQDDFQHVLDDIQAL
jgi:hypothetical protein